MLVGVAIATLPSITMAEANCRETMAFIDSRLPHFSEGNLESIRQSAVSMNVLETMEKAKAQGLDAQASVQASLAQARENDGAAKSAAGTASAADAFGTSDEVFLKHLTDGTIDPNQCNAVRDSALCSAIANKITAVAIRALAAEMQCFIRAGIGPFADGAKNEKQPDSSTSAGSKAMFQAEMNAGTSAGKSQMSQFATPEGNTNTISQREQQLRQEMNQNRVAHEQRAAAERARAEAQRASRASYDSDESDASGAEVFDALMGIGSAIIGSGVLSSGGGRSSGGSRTTDGSSSDTISTPAGGSGTYYCEAPPCR